MQLGKSPRYQRLYLHMSLWGDDTTLHALGILADKDIAECLESNLEDSLVRHLSDVGRLCI